MADQNLLDQGLSTPNTTEAPPSPTSPNLLDAGLSGGASSFTPATQTASTSSNLLDAGLGTASVRKTDESQQPPPNQSFLSKAWDWANTPLTESLGGIPESREGAGGLERGAEKVLSGFTSPLSLLLTVGTLGTAGFLESAGANVLKSMALSEGLGEAAATEQVTSFAKAAEAATSAFKLNNPVKAAVEATGMDYNKFRAIQNTLYDTGLKESDLLSGNLTQRGVSSAFRNLGVDAVKAQKIAKGTEFLMNVGFTGQQISSAVQTVPKVFDLLKEGRYDDAAEYMVEGGVGGALGLLGASHALHSAGETFGSPDEIHNLKPTEENQQALKFANERDLAHQDASLAAQNWEQAVRKEMGAKLGFSKVFESKGSREEAEAKSRKLLVAMDTGNDPELARQTGNALADAIGKPERKLNLDDVAERRGSTPSSPETQTGELLSPRSDDISAGVRNGEPVPGSTEGEEEGNQIHPGLPADLADRIANAKLNDKSKAYISKFIDAYHDVAKGLTEDEQGIYQKLRDRDDQNWAEGNTNNLIGSKIEDHIHHVWGPDTDVGNRLIQEARTGKMDTNVTQARKRVWDTYLEGLLRGRQLVTDDPVGIIGHDMAGIRKAAANREFIDKLRDSNTRGSDGRPMVVMSGTGHAVEGANGENPAVMVNPNRVRNIAIADNAVAALRNSGDFQRFLDRGDIISLTPQIRPDNIDSYIDKFENKSMGQNNPQYDAEGNNILRKDINTLKAVKNGTLPATALDEINARQKQSYAWHPQDYVTPRDKTLSGWNWLTKTDDGTNIIARSNIKFHPEIADYLINRLGLEKSYLRENKGIGKITSPLLKGGGEVKKILLSFSPFHLQQEALRAIMMGVNPLRIDPIGELSERGPMTRERANLATAVENGMTLAPDRNALEEHSAGVAEHSPVLSKIPVVGKFLDWYQDFLFNRYIPSMKAKSAKLMFDKYEQAHPDWSRDAVGKAVADHVNNAFGGQNWRAAGRAAATQDWFHLLTLAPDWLQSEMRFAASTLRGGLNERNFSREQTAKMALGLWGTARVLNLLTTGNMHLEAPFGLATKDKDGKETIYSVRTLPTDILHMASDPVGFIKGRMSPFAHMAVEAATQRDAFGHKLTPGDMSVDIAKNMAPIPGQALLDFLGGSPTTVGNAGQLLKAGGVTVSPYRTEAQKTAANLTAEKDENGVPITPAKMRRNQAISRLEDDIRSGQTTLSQINDARDFGDLSESEHKRVVDNIKLTAGLDPSTARMVSNVSRMDLGSAFKVWDSATPNEKSALVKTLIKKKNAYMKRAIKEQTADERLNDPVFRRVRLMFNQPLTENNP